MKKAVHSEGPGSCQHPPLDAELLIAPMDKDDGDDREECVGEGED